VRDLGLDFDGLNLQQTDLSIVLASVEIRPGKATGGPCATGTGTRGDASRCAS